jgi:hypothetical protein
MNYSDLNEARARVAEARAAIAKDDEALQEIRNQVAILEARIVTLKQRQEAKGLREQLAAAERDLSQAEEAVLDAINLELAALIVKRQASDPVQHSEWIMANLVKLRDSVRSALDVPVNKKFSQHPLITQALALLPPRDGLNVPVWELGYTLTGHTDWASRRRAIISRAEAESTSPLETA